MIFRGLKSRVHASVGVSNGRPALVGAFGAFLSVFTLSIPDTMRAQSDGEPATETSVSAQSDQAGSFDNIGSPTRRAFQISPTSIFGTAITGANAGSGSSSSANPVRAGLGYSTGFEWDHTKSTGGFSIKFISSLDPYSGSYGAKALNNSLSLTAQRQLSPRWLVSLSGIAAVVTQDQFLFAGIPDSANSNDTQTKTNSANGAPPTPQPSAPPLLATSSSSVLFYGQQLLNTSAAAQLTYAWSPRLSYNFEMDGFRTEGIGGHLEGALVAPVTTSGSVKAGMNYTLSPTSRIGFFSATTASETASQSLVLTSIVATYERSLSERLSLEFQAGTSVDISNHTQTPSGGPQFTGGFGLGYHTNNYQLSITTAQNTVNVYGLGARLTWANSITFLWARPASNWGFIVSGGQERMAQATADLLAPEHWRINLEARRYLGSHWYVATSYAYLTNLYSAGSGGGTGGLQGIRLSIVWTPEQRRPL